MLSCPVSRVVSEPEDPQCEDFEDQAPDLEQGKPPLNILSLYLNLIMLLEKYYALIGSHLICCPVCKADWRTYFVAFDPSFDNCYTMSPCNHPVASRYSCTQCEYRRTPSNLKSEKQLG